MTSCKPEIIKTNPINNKDIQSNKKVIIIDLPFNVSFSRRTLLHGISKYV